MVVVEPGGTKTEWSGIAVENMRKVSGAGAYRSLVDAWERIEKLDGMSAEPGEIAKAIVRAASARRPKTRYVAPLSGRIMLGLRWMLSDRAFDWVFSKFFAIPKQLGQP